ncbi:endonuclease domain-containing protein [Pontibacter ramchanderi]|uniref:endonuclease domain-containing protein n=1 Tax=Pontibacter ramchanderi TaxID=1179743 RepID=UPI000C70BCCE
MLRGKKLERRKFRRQPSIENYEVDFYCGSEKLVIEVDGSVHDSPEAIENDSLRDETLTIGDLIVMKRSSIKCRPCYRK